jgi:hypothetical protein
LVIIPPEYFRKIEQNRERWAFVPYRDLVEDVGITVLGLLRRLGYHMDTESESLSVTDCPDGDRSSSINDIENDKSNSNSKNCNSTNNTYEDDIDGSIDGKCENTDGTDSTDNNIDSNNNNDNNNNNDSSNDNSSNNDYENTATSSSTPYRPPVTITPSYNGCSSSGYTPDSSHTASTNKTRSENEKYFPYNLSSEFSGQVPKNREFEKLYCLLELENEKKGVC